MDPLLDRLPNSGAGVAGALGDGEEHDVVGEHAGDGGVLRPVVCQVMDGLAGLGLEDGLTDAAVGVAGRADELDIVVAVERVGVAGPPVQPGVEEVRHRRVGLHTHKIRSIWS